MYYPRVLVIANNSFSNTDNNGRTLGNLFVGWPKDKLAQFCISTDGPNFDICDNYYCITDKEILSAFLHLRKAVGKKLIPEKQPRLVGSRGEGRKTLFMMFVRNIVWGKRRWKSLAFMNWVKDFNPEVVLLFFGESAFMLNIGEVLAEEFKAPLIMFNTEGYYFFKTNYYRTKTAMDWLWFPVVQGLFRKQVRKTMKIIKHSVYLNQMLQSDYDNEFGGPSSVIYTSSTLTHEDHLFHDEYPVFSYLGNMTFDRPKALMEIADVLQGINANYQLNIYGKPLDEETKKTLINHPGIVYKGFVSFDEVQKVMQNSDILFHAETQDKKWEESLKYGFSTKIADSLSSGACFVLYASPNIACSQYIQTTQSGWFADNKDDLKKCIEEILFDKEKRQRILTTAQRVVEENHSLQKNRKLFHQIIYDVYNNKSSINK